MPVHLVGRHNFNWCLGELKAFAGVGMLTTVDRFEAGYTRLTTFLIGLVAISIASFAILIPLDLLIRSLKWGNLWWLYEGVEYALYFGVFFGAPWVLQQGAHVRVDVLVTVLPEATGKKVDFVLDLAGAALCAYLFYLGIISTITDFIDEAIPDKLLIIPNWYMMAVFASTFFLLSIAFLLRAWRVFNPLEGAAKPDIAEAGF